MIRLVAAPDRHRGRASLLGALLVGAVAFAVGIPRLDPAPVAAALAALGAGSSGPRPVGMQSAASGRDLAGGGRVAPAVADPRRLPAPQADRLGSTGAPVVPQALAGAGASARSAAGIRLAGLD